MWLLVVCCLQVSRNLTRLKYYANKMQLNSVTFKNFKTFKTKPNVFPVHMIKNQFYSSV